MICSCDSCGISIGASLCMHACLLDPCVLDLRVLLMAYGVLTPRCLALLSAVALHAVYECLCGFAAATATAMHKHLTSPEVQGV
jgi:hypothetical protein